MPRWTYDTAAPPPAAFEAVDGARARLVASGLLVSGAYYLASNDQVYAHEEPAKKPTDGRWVTISEWQEAGGAADAPDGDTRVFARIHVAVRCQRGKILTPPAWHAAMHDRIARALVGKVPATGFSRSAPDANGFRRVTRPTRAEYFDDSKAYESFALYEITLQPLSLSEP